MNSNISKLLVYVMLVSVTAGCLTEDVGYSNSSIPKANQLDISFKSSPNSPTILGTLYTGEKIYSGSSVDILVEYNGTIIEHCGSFSESGCSINPITNASNWRSAEHSVQQNEKFPSCYDNCRFVVYVYYLGEEVSIFEAINF
jgi:hypothetical protein